MLWGSSQKQNLAGVLQQRDDTEENESGNEERAYGVSNQPAELPDEDGGDDHANAAQGVGQDMEKDTWRKINQ